MLRCAASLKLLQIKIYILMAWFIAYILDEKSILLYNVFSAYSRRCLLVRSMQQD